MTTKTIILWRSVGDDADIVARHISLDYAKDHALKEALRTGDQHFVTIDGEIVGGFFGDARCLQDWVCDAKGIRAVAGMDEHTANSRNF